MSQPEILRRPSYGPSSPVVGQRGARTRQQIAEATLRVLAERGFHEILVDDIAQAAGVSRATLYQYFESKEQLFVELVEESGAALMRLVRRLGPLGPTPQGFDNLHWWLGEWGWIYDKYATVFIQWSAVDSPRAPLRPLLAQFMDRYTSRLSARLVEAGVEGIDVEGASVALFAVIERYNYYRHTRTSPLSEDELLDNLAVVAQLVLFPSTPPEVLVRP